MSWAFPERFNQYPAWKISWVYVVMELVGDYSENPFEGLSNDVPMLTLSRTIEIDLLQQLGETDLPAPIQPVNHVLL